jgi:hypothetical protein
MKYQISRIDSDNKKSIVFTDLAKFLIGKTKKKEDKSSETTEVTTKDLTHLELWIIKRSGNLLFYDNNPNENNYKYIGDKDIDVFSGYLSAIVNILKESLDQSVQKIQLNDSSISFHYNAKYGIFFVIRAKLDKKDEELKSFLQSFNDQFINTQLENIKKYDGNREIFKDFEIKT